MIMAQHPRRNRFLAMVLLLAFAMTFTLNTAFAASDNGASVNESFFNALNSTAELMASQAEAKNALITWPSFENPDGKSVRSQFDLTINDFSINTPDFSTDTMPDIIKQLGIRTIGQLDLEVPEIFAGLALLTDGSPLLSALFLIDSETVNLASPEISDATFSAAIDTFVEDFNSSPFAEAFGTTIPEDFNLSEYLTPILEALGTAASISVDPEAISTDELLTAFEPLVQEVQGYVESFTNSWIITSEGQKEIKYADETVTCDTITANIPQEALNEYLLAVANRVYGGEEFKSLVAEIGAASMAIIAETEGESIDPEEFEEQLNATIDQLLVTLPEALGQISFPSGINYTIQVSPDGIILEHEISADITENPTVYDSETGEIDEEATAEALEYATIVNLKITCKYNGIDSLADDLNCKIVLSAEGEEISLTLVSKGNSIPDEEGLISDTWEGTMKFDNQFFTVSGSSSYGTLDNSFSYAINMTMPGSVKASFSLNGSVETTEDSMTASLDSCRLTYSDDTVGDIDIDIKAVLLLQLLDGIDFPGEKVISAFTDEAALVEFQNASNKLMTILSPIITPFMEVMQDEAE